MRWGGHFRQHMPPLSLDLKESSAISGGLTSSVERHAKVLLAFQSYGSPRGPFA